MHDVDTKIYFSLDFILNILFLNDDEKIHHLIITNNLSISNFLKITTSERFRIRALLNMKINS